MKQSLPGLVTALLLLLISSATTAQASASAVASAPAPEHRQWIVDMKAAERGPFSRLRWFCNDGRILPPKAYACGEASGYQHGEWSDQTRELRDQGYRIANLLAGIDAQAQITQPDFNDNYNQRLIEKYLIAADDGWILRRAMFYRGAIQEEDRHKFSRHGEFGRFRSLGGNHGCSWVRSRALRGD